MGLGDPIVPRRHRVFSSESVEHPQSRPPPGFVLTSISGNHNHMNKEEDDA